MSDSELPAGVCDTHMHFYDSWYPVARGALLEPPDATVDDYRLLQAALGLQRVVVVQPTTYGLDNSCQIDAAAAFGDDARLVVVVDDTTPDGELARFTSAGARGARFHMLPGGAVGWEIMAAVAQHIADHGWHIQLQMDGRLLTERLDQLVALPVPLVVDHVGRFMPPVTPDDDRFRALLTLIDTGRCWVKLSAPYESTHEGAPHYPTVASLVDVLVANAPERMLWASNWPHPGQAHPLDVDDLRRLLFNWLPTPELRQRVLVDNPAELYDFAPVTDRPAHHHLETS